VVPALAVIAAAALSAQTVIRGLGLAGGAIALAVCGIVRDWGKKLEPTLWANWGGNPAARRLRWRDAEDEEAVRRLHERLSAVLDVPLPDRDAEMEAPGAADRRYDEAIAALRERTRDKDRFQLVFAENVDYGFRRNSLGLKKVALVVALAALALAVALVAWRRHQGQDEWLPWAIVIAISLAAALYWWRIVTPDWVRRAAERYADRLLEAVHTLRRESMT
jgi:hypothetical protein